MGPRKNGSEDRWVLALLPRYMKLKRTHPLLKPDRDRQAQMDKLKYQIYCLTNIKIGRYGSVIYTILKADTLIGNKVTKIACLCKVWRYRDGCDMVRIDMFQCCLLQKLTRYTKIEKW